MKKFHFSLETVLDYKDQVLESLQEEHALLLAQVRDQEEVLEALWHDYRACNEEYRTKKQTGMTVLEATTYQHGLRALEAEIQKETQRLEDLRRQAEAKRAQVVAAKQETSSLEKLKEKKLDAYQKAAAKSEERELEEFVSGARVRGATA
jgi:flagellar FliJ protein